MRLLVVAPFLPDARAAHGGGLYLGTLCEALAERAEVGLAAFVRPDEMARLTADGRPFSYVAPTPLQERPRSGPGRLGHQARMLARWGPGRMPLLAAKNKSKAMAAAIRRAVAQFAPDAALVELAQSAQYLRHLAPVPTILTDHESGVPANAGTELGAWADRRDARLWRAYVQRLYPHADLLQAVTPEDAASLERMLGRPVSIRAPTVRVEDRPVDPAKAPPRALFLGNYSHLPNREAAATLARDVLPRLRARIAGAELWLAGPHEDRLGDLAALPGVRVHGYAADLAALFAQARLMLAPLYSGGGVRMKGLSALAHGLPVVTNALGARGLSVPPPARIVVESSGELAGAALALLADPARAAAAGRAAHAWARSNLAPGAVAAAQIERVAALLRSRSA